jgi:hypothetical protein
MGSKFKDEKPNMVVNAYNPSNQKAEAGRL